MNHQHGIGAASVSNRPRDRLTALVILLFWFALPWVVEAIMGSLYRLRLRPWDLAEHLLPLLLIVGAYRAAGLWPNPLLHLLYGCLGGAVFVSLGIQYGGGTFYGPLLPGGTERLVPLVVNAAVYAMLIGLLCRWAARLGAERGPDG